MIQLLIALLLAHVVGDFVLQPDKWVKDKETKKIKSRYLLWHVVLHALLMMVATGFQFQYWIGFVVISISHYLLDVGKLYIDKKKSVLSFIIDQLLHLFIIFIVVWAYYPRFHIDWSILLKPTFQLLIVCLVTATFVTSIIIKLLLQKWSFRIIKTDKSAADAATNKAGQYIGILERLFIFYFVVIGFWAGIGFLFTAKSIFRFNDLSRENDRNYTEYIIIGTLMSFATATATGLLYTFCIQWLSK